MNFKTYKRVIKEHPEIELKSRSMLKAVLTDFAEIQLVAAVFGEYYGMDFPKDLFALPPRTASQIGIKFTALCLYCFDPESIKGPYYKKMKNYMRSTIADFLKTNHCQVSHYLSHAKVYMNAYEPFRNDIFQLIAIVKIRKEFKI